MNELIQKLVGEVKLDEATAKKAIEVVAGFIKGKLPAPVAEQVTGILNGVEAKDIAGKANDLLGGFMK